MPKMFEAWPRASLARDLQISQEIQISKTIGRCMSHSLREMSSV